MSDRIRCTCQRCTIRGLMGPVIVVTVGVLFLLAEMRGGYFDFGNTYPVILIVIGSNQSCVRHGFHRRACFLARSRAAV